MCSLHTVGQKMLRTSKGNYVNFENHFKFLAAVDVKKCLKYIILFFSLNACATLSVLPSYTSTVHFYIDIVKDFGFFFYSFGHRIRI